MRDRSSNGRTRRNKEAESIGVSDHLVTELPTLIEFARSGKLRFPSEALRVIDLDAAQINAALDALQDSIDHVRTVIKVASDPPSDKATAGQAN